MYSDSDQSNQNHPWYKTELEELTSETLPQYPPLSLKADDSFPTENGRFIN